MAQTSILGSLLANALLVLGVVIVVGARTSEGGIMRFHTRLPNDTATLMLLACFIIVLRGISVSTEDRASSHQVEISAAGAVVLLAVYGTRLWSLPAGRHRSAGGGKGRARARPVAEGRARPPRHRRRGRGCSCRTGSSPR